MTNPDEYLDQSRRTFARTIAQALTILSTLMFLITVGFLLFQISWAVIFYAATMAVVFCGSILTLVWLPRRPIATALTPLILTCLIAIVLPGIMFRNLTVLAAACIPITIVLVGIAGNRRLNVSVGITAFIATIVLAIPWPIPDLSSALGAFTPILGATAPIFIVILIWAILDRLILMQSSAIQLAHVRLREAEHARDVADTARQEIERRNAEQQRLLELVQTLELPVLKIGKGMLAVPLIGHLDTRRMERIRTSVLESVNQERAHTVIFDITGVTLMDTGVAQNLIQTSQAVRLLGARARLTGISPIIAQTLVALGVGLESLETVSDLHTAISQ